MKEKKKKTYERPCIYVYEMEEQQILVGSSMEQPTKPDEPMEFDTEVLTEEDYEW